MASVAKITLGGSVRTQVPGDHMSRTSAGLPPGAQVATFTNFELESGVIVEELTVAFHTYGQLNESRDNAVVVGHSLTSNSAVSDWWPELLGAGDGFSLDSDTDFVLCANYICSPYGTTLKLRQADALGLATASATLPIGLGVVTVRDNVRAQRLLLDHLGVSHIRLVIGGSMGGFLALEWAASYPDFVSDVVLIATCSRHSDWAIGINECQRAVITASEESARRAAAAAFSSSGAKTDDPATSSAIEAAAAAGALAGMYSARMSAMLYYRAPDSIDARFQRSAMAESSGSPSSEHEQPSFLTGAAAKHEPKPKPFFSVSSYLHHQGKTFVGRFTPESYRALTHTLDSHDVTRNRGTVEEVLGSLPHRTLVVGISSDVLYPLALSEELARHMPGAQLHVLDSPHGHDSFLIEIRELNKVIRRFRRSGGGTASGDASPKAAEPAAPADSNFAPGTPIQAGELSGVLPVTAGGSDGSQHDRGAHHQPGPSASSRSLLKWDTASLPWHIAAVPRDFQLRLGGSFGGGSSVDLSGEGGVPSTPGASTASGGVASWWLSPAVARGWTLTPVYGKSPAVVTAGAPF